MNILVLSWRDTKHPLSGGAEQVMHEHMKGWISAGHSVTLFSSYLKGGLRNEIVDGVNIKRNGSQFLGVHIYAALYYLLEKHAKFDLVVDQFHGPPFFTPIYVRKPKLAVLQEVAREVWLINHLPKPFNWIVGWIGYLAEPMFFLFYKNTPFMVGSESAKKDLIEMGISPKKIHVIPHGVIVTLPNKKLRKEKTPTILFLGALAKDKGIEDAIRAFGILNKTGKYNFWVVGKGSDQYLNILKKLCKKQGVESNVHFFGFVKEQKKFELLSRAHIMINPSVREGWGLVNIEANAAGTPVVAYSSAGLVDSIKNGKSGFLCEENSPKSIADHVINLLSDKNFYARMQRSSIAWSKKFSWHSSKKLSLELLDKVIENSPL